MSCAERGRRSRRFPLEVRAARTPDAPALVFRAGVGKTQEQRSINFRDLDRLTADIAAELRGHGISPGERVALRLPPDDRYPVLLLSLLRAGAVAVPISTRLPKGAVSVLLERVGCRRLIGGGTKTVLPGVECLPATELVRGTGSSPGRPPRQGGPAGEIQAFDRRAPATIVFTSGSTGVPKAAVHSFENHWASASGSNRNIPLRPGDRWLLSLPLWHVGGLAILFRCLLGGAALAIPVEGASLAESITALGVTHLSLVATQLFRLLRDDRGRAALRRLEAVLLGGGPAPAALVQEAVRAGVPLVASYGSTETCSQATATAPNDPPEALRTAGRPLGFREVSIADNGEILVRGRTLFLGYVEGDGIRPARDAAGWFRTGDLGRFDSAGRLVVAGRRDMMFISGGENIHPEEIEREILRHPGLLEAIVVPIADAEFGARPAAFLRTADGTPPDAASIGRLLRETLPGFKVPVRYLPWPDLAEGMKPDRRALAALAAKDYPDAQAPAAT